MKNKEQTEQTEQADTEDPTLALEQAAEAVEEGYGVRLTDSEKDLIKMIGSLALLFDVIESQGFTPLVGLMVQNGLQLATDTIRKVICEPRGLHWQDDWKGERL